MQLKMMGLDYKHKRGEFCRKMIFNHYTVCCFSTPFLYFYDGKMVQGDKWQVLINPPGSVVYHGPRSESKSGFINDWFYVFGNDFADLLKKYPLPLNRSFSVDQSFFLREFGNRLLKEFNLQDEGASDIIKCVLTEMIIKLHRAYNAANSSDFENDSIKDLKQQILLEPQKKWTLEEMSKISGYSVSRFCELYCEKYGVSPINDVINVRIELAKKLLSSGQATISSVAEACGFRTINYFSARFKKETGLSPAEFAKQDFYNS